MNRRKNMFQDFKPEIKLFLLVALIAVVISAAGILLLKGTQVPPSAPAPQPQVLDTSDWETYRNGMYGFEFRYPSEFYQFGPGTPERIGWAHGLVKEEGPERHIIVFAEAEVGPLEEYLNVNVPEGELRKTANITVGGKPAFQEEFVAPDSLKELAGADSLMIDTFIEVSPFLIVHVMVSSHDSLREFNKQILSTFRVLDPNECELQETCDPKTGEVREFNFCESPPPPNWTASFRFLDSNKCELQILNNWSSER